MSVLDNDIITIIISYILFWSVVVILILYPKLKQKKTLQRIKNLEKNTD